MTDLVRREYQGELRVRAAGPDGSQRVIEGVILPFGAIAEVQDSPTGPRYRETIAPGAMDGLASDGIVLDVLTGAPRDYNTHEGATTVGRSFAVQADQAQATAAFRVARTAAGDEALALAEDRVLRGLSVSFRPVKSRTRADGVVERTAIDVRRVALVERGAYGGASVTAVRAAMEGDMPDQETTGAKGAQAETEDEDEATQAPEGKRPNRTRVTVDVERAAASEEADRAAAERATVAQVAGGSRRPVIFATRQDLIYRADSTWSGEDDRGKRYSLLSDGWKARNGDRDAADRLHRWTQLSAEIERRMEAEADVMSRAGDVLSSEIPGAYPNDYVPGLLTPRILKGRPMGGFYNRFPISDGLPKIFPKVTTSTTVAAQGAEGSNPAASDFATTAVTATPVLYGAETVVSRQVLDGASPAAEAMILQDMVEAYAQASEAVIKTAVEAGSSASGSAITAATPYAGCLANVIAYYAARFRGAGAQFIPSALYSVLLAQGDTTGRPFLPMIGSVNSDATVQEGGSSGRILGAQVLLSYSSTVNVVVTGAATDFVIFESPISRFSYDAVTGPSGVRVGLWAYLVVGARLGSLKVTAA